MSRDLDGVLAAIDGALYGDTGPDAMRWSPEPEEVAPASPFDGLIFVAARTGAEAAAEYERVGREVAAVLAGPSPEEVQEFLDTVAMAWQQLAANLAAIFDAVGDALNLAAPQLLALADALRRAEESSTTRRPAGRPALLQHARRPRHHLGGVHARPPRTVQGHRHARPSRSRR